MVDIWLSANQEGHNPLLSSNQLVNTSIPTDSEISGKMSAQVGNII